MAKEIYDYSRCFITDSDRFVLLDDDNNMRGNSNTLEGIVSLKIELGWGTIKRMKITAKGIEFGEVIE